MYVKMVGIFRKLIRSWTEKGWKLSASALFENFLWVWGLQQLKAETTLKFRQVWTSIQGEADPRWLYLQWRYKVCSSPRRPQGWGVGGHGDEGHDEVEESWIARDQSIIAPVGLYWLFSLTGLPRSMCSQAFCMGRWRSVPGLTLASYSDACVRVSVIY